MFVFQESVRKAADLTLKTLSKVRIFVTRLACVYMCVSVFCVLMWITKLPVPQHTFPVVSRCVLVCVSLLALQPRELWQCCCLLCWKKALLAMSQRSARSGNISRPCCGLSFAV